MSKKDYKAIARIIHFTVIDVYPAGDVWPLADLVIGLSAHFKRDDPRFDEDEFRKACGLA